MRTRLAGVRGKTFDFFTGRKAVLGLIGVCIALRDECVGIFDEYGIHVAGRVTARNFSPRNHHQVETGARASGLLVCAVAVRVRNVFDGGLQFEVPGRRAVRAEFTGRTPIFQLVRRLFCWECGGVLTAGGRTLFGCTYSGHCV
ncbi:MAG: hypothetical protein CMD83_08055, partial [Gammaproteobacteria bacterium]|nr:hypothetical protein [Gammaproteobacteria bacterium]